MPTPAVVLVAGVDPSGGSGVALDAAFLGRLGVRAAPVVATLAVHDAQGLRRLEAVDDILFEQALDGALDVLGSSVRAIKAGLVIAPGHARRVARIAAARGIPLVVDPLALALDPERFGGLDAGRLVVPLLRAATLVTADAAEASSFSGEPWDGTRDGLLRLARGLVGSARTAAVSDAQRDGDTLPLALAGPEGERFVEVPRPPRGRTPGSTQGTRCAFSAAAAGYIALGLPPLEAAAAAHRFAAEALAAASGVPGAPLSPEPWAL